LNKKIILVLLNPEKRVGSTDVVEPGIKKLRSIDEPVTIKKPT
jgi:hypothetical protein